MRYLVEVAATSLAPLCANPAALTYAMNAVGSEVTVSDSHTAGSIMTIEANGLAEAINTGLDRWLVALRPVVDNARAISVSAARAE